MKKVLILDSKKTLELNLSGKTGDVYGWTIPSQSGIEFIRNSDESDFAINVVLDDDGESLWIDEKLVSYL